MDYDSSSKFISSLAKFLQSLCNGYVEFDSGVQVIGHLYLSVDTGKTIDYILNEKVCKTDENSVTFISNSFHAQPAEKPKPGKKPAKDSDKADLKYEDNSDHYQNAQGEPQSTNIGTLPPARNSSRNSPHLTKRPYSPSHKLHSKSGRTSPRHKKSKLESFDQNISQMSNPASENSFSPAPSPVIDSGCGSLNVVSANSSEAAHINESFQQGYFQPDDNSVADDSEERDIKPSIDTDVTFIKEEYAPPSSCSQSGNQSRDRTNDEESSTYSFQSNPVFPGSYPGGFGASQRSNFNSSGSSHLFSPGQSSSHLEENSGDPSVFHSQKSISNVGRSVTVIGVSKTSTSLHCTSVLRTSVASFKNFMIDLAWLPLALKKDFEAGRKPSPVLRRELVRIIVEQMMRIDGNPTKAHCETVATSIVQRYLNSFADTAMGEDVACSAFSLAKQLKSRIENVLRNRPFKRRRAKTRTKLTLVSLDDEIGFE